MENYESKLEGIVTVNKEIENYVLALEKDLQGLREQFTTVDNQAKQAQVQQMKIKLRLGIGVSKDSEEPQAT